MKRILQTCLGTGILLCNALSAYHGEDMDPFEIESYGYLVADQPITKSSGSWNQDHFNGTNVQFGEAHAGLRYHYICSGCCEEFLIGLGYTYTHLRWDPNPFFHQQKYENVNLDLGAKIGCICDWDILGFLRSYMDMGSPNDHYFKFDGMVWGRLNHRPNLGINLGGLLFTGMSVNRFYPIFGIDWEPFPGLELNMVFPTNMNITYELTRYFSVAVAGKLLYSRQRVRRQDKYEDFNPANFTGVDNSNVTQYFGPPEVPQQILNFPPNNFNPFLNPHDFGRALWEYRAWGIEGVVEFNCDDTFNITVFAGWSFQNKLTIAAHSFNHKQTYELQNAPYGGFEFNLRF